MKKAGIIGMGVSGRAALLLLQRLGYQAYCYDDQQVQGCAITELAQMPFANMEFCMLSPGVPRQHPAVLAALPCCPVIGEVELGLRHLHPKKIVGITGTNGKTTVTSLISFVLNACGIKARACGNIGYPLCALQNEDVSQEILVVEMSSYQIETLSSCFFDSSVLLNITPDHLDRYASMQEYALCKFGLGECTKGNFYSQKQAYFQWGKGSKKPVCLFGQDPECFIKAKGDYILVKEKIESILPVGYRGRYTYDVENYLAAFALCRECGISGEQFAASFSHFKKPPHRLQFVRNWKGIDFYDDSKATNIDAVIKAIEAFQRPVILIAGGMPKGASYNPWIEPFKEKVRKMLVIGQAADMMDKELSAHIPLLRCASLQEAVEQAATLAQAGHVVLLSPGCSSLDMFQSYVHRGQEFQRLVGLL